MLFRNWIYDDKSRRPFSAKCKIEYSFFFLIKGLQPAERKCCSPGFLNILANQADNIQGRERKKYKSHFFSNDLIV